MATVLSAAVLCVVLAGAMGCMPKDAPALENETGGYAQCGETGSPDVWAGDADASDPVTGADSAGLGEGLPESDETGCASGQDMEESDAGGTDGSGAGEGPAAGPDAGAGADAGDAEGADSSAGSDPVADGAQDGPDAGAQADAASAQAPAALGTAGAAVPAAAAPSRATSPSVSYRSHVAGTGWKAYASNGGTSGGVAAGRDVEAVRVKVSGIDGGVSYAVYFKGTGWQKARTAAQTAGTTGKSTPIQAFRAKLTGAAARSYDLFYRVYVRGLGWLDWTSGWKAAGTTGYGRALQGLQMRLVRKSDPAPSSAGSAAPVAYVSAPKVSVSSHVQNIGWQKAVGNNKVSGTTGKGLRMEAVRISISNSRLTGGARTSAHVQNIGWMKYVGNGKTAGTTGKGLRIEAVKLGLNGQMAKVYDVRCKVHVQNIGWTDWASAYKIAGTSGRALRLEGIKVYVTLKDNEKKPSNNTGSTSDPTPSPTPALSKNIMGTSAISASKLASWYRGMYGNGAYPSGALSRGGASTIERFSNLVASEAKAEGVRAEVVFAQMMFETGHLNYGGLVDVSQFNYCGLKTSDGAAFQSFPDVRTGIRAHVQHLKAYASTASLANACVDPRFNLVTRGIAPTLDGLSTRWSNESDYGERVYDYLKRIVA
ncbi:MAG: glucosaminidase domain-containing protein [Eggerthellaceae bacterium]